MGCMSGTASATRSPPEDGTSTPDGAATAAAALQAGHDFALLLLEDDADRAETLERLLASVTDTATAVVRVTNPLRARLTLERLLIQVFDGGTDPDADVATVVRRIAGAAPGASRTILVIERAETLHSEVLQFLADAAPYFAAERPLLQVLFTGLPGFRPMLDDPDAAFEAVPPEHAEPPAPTTPAAPPAAKPHGTFQPGLREQVADIWNEGWPTRIGIVGGTLVGLGAIAFAVYLAFAPPPPPLVVEAAPAPELPAAPADEPDHPVLRPGPPTDPETAALRAEFQSYLVATGRTPRGATPVQNRAWFEEFLVWRARTRR